MITALIAEPQVATANEQTSSTFENIQAYISDIKSRRKLSNTYAPVEEVRHVINAGLVPVEIRRARNKDGKWIKYPEKAEWQKSVPPTKSELDEVLEEYTFPTNYGILTGRQFADGRYLFVVDVDSKSNGLESFARLLDSLGVEFQELTKTLVCATQSNGLHIYLKTTSPLPQTQGKDGIDTRSVGGQVVGGGSVMRDEQGNPAWYQFNQEEDFQILDCPVALEQFFASINTKVAEIKPSKPGTFNSRPTEHGVKLYQKDPSEIEAGKERHPYLVSVAGYRQNHFDHYDEFSAFIFEVNGQLKEPKNDKAEIQAIIDYAWGNKPKVPAKPWMRSYFFEKVQIPVQLDDGEIVNRVDYQKRVYKSCHDNDDFLRPLSDKRIVAYARSKDEIPMLLGKDGDNITIIESGTTLVTFLAEFYDVDLECLKHASYFISPEKLFAFYRQKVNVMGLRYSAISIVPEFEPQPDTLYLCKEVKPLNTGRLKELVEIFTFLSPTDKYRFTAMVMSMMLNSKWIRQFPLVLIRAANKSAGKTYVVQQAAYLVQGQPAISIEGTERDKEQFDTLSNMGNKICLYDNLDKPDHKVLNRITINATADTLDMHIMGVRHGKVRNNKIHCGTINSDSAVNDDIIERAMPIHMSHTVDAKTKAKISRFVHNVQCQAKYTEELQADILYWMGQGAQYTDIVTCDHPPKVGLWAEEVGPMVYALFKEEIPDAHLDFSADEDDKEMSTEYFTGKTLIEDLWVMNSFDPEAFFVPFEKIAEMLHSPNMSGKSLSAMVARWNVSFQGKARFESKRRSLERGYLLTVEAGDFFSDMSDYERGLMATTMKKVGASR